MDKVNKIWKKFPKKYLKKPSEGNERKIKLERILSPFWIPNTDNFCHLHGDDVVSFAGWDFFYGWSWQGRVWICMDVWFRKQNPPPLGQVIFSKLINHWLMFRRCANCNNIVALAGVFDMWDVFAGKRKLVGAGFWQQLFLAPRRFFCTIGFINLTRWRWD